MKVKAVVISSLILLIIFAGCSFNYTESGKQIDMEKDGKELSLAKKSLQFIKESKMDSLKGILNEEIIEKTTPKQLEWIILNGKRIIDNTKYPHDSILTVSSITKKSISKVVTSKEFNFPFINVNNPDSTMYFNISVVEGKIYKLMISTGTRIRKIN